MKAVLISMAAGLTLGACASVNPGADHAAHHPGRTAATNRMDQQMRMMQEMHQKMKSAKTPEERQALMAEHMKAMQGGMTMMCEMGQMMGGAGASAGMPMTQPGMPMTQPGTTTPGMPMASDATRQEMMQRCMDMRDMTLRMMMDREAAPK